MSAKAYQDLGGLVTVVSSKYSKWEERRVRWNHFSNETSTEIIAIPKNAEDLLKIVNWARVKDILK